MIRLLITLLVIAGAIYLLVFNRAEEDKKVEVQYQKNVDKIEDMEQKMLQDANNLDQKVDDLSQ